MTTNKRVLACVLGTQIISGIAPVMAEGRLTLDEIVVTATKRTENLQDIPASISAVTGDDMSRLGIDDLDGLQQVVPNLVFNQFFGTTMVSIRGVGSTIDSGVTEPTVAMYVDGVYLPRSTMATLRGVDLERVEVLRGPQGTLYGRNATGGAVNFISKAPSDEFEGSITGSLADRDGYGFSGAVSGPLTPNVRARLSGGHEQQDGYVESTIIDAAGNVVGGQDIVGTDVNYVRGAVSVDVGSSVSVDASVRYEESKAAGAVQQRITESPFAPSAWQTVEPNKIIANKTHSSRVETTVSALTINWDINSAMSLKSITSYVDHKSTNAVDADGTGLDFYDNREFPRNSESYGQEFTLSGDSDKLKWLMGAFLFHEEAYNILPVHFGDVGSSALGLPPDGVIGFGVDSESDSWALYGDLEYFVTEDFSVGLGLRQNHEEQDLVQLLDFSFLPPTLTFPLETDEDKLLPKVVLKYTISPDISVYGQFSKGYKSGGANLPGFDGGLFGNLYGPENLDAYEVGLKSEWLEGALVANMAAYYYDYSDLQMTIVIPPATTLVNNADATVKGMEAELKWLVTDALSLDLAGTWTHARFDGFGGPDEAQGFAEVDLDGEPIPRAPDYTFNIGVEYLIPMEGDVFSELSLRANARYSDDVVLRYFGQPNDIQEAYTLVDVSASLYDSTGMTDLTLFVRNVGDKEYKHNVSYILGGYVGNYSEPRNFGLKLTRRF